MTVLLVIAHSCAAVALSITALVLSRTPRPPAASRLWAAIGLLFLASAPLGAFAAGPVGRFGVALSTLLGAAGMLLYHRAASALVGRPPRRWPFLLLLGGVVAALWFTVAVPNFTARSVTVGLIAAALLSGVAGVFLGAPAPPARGWVRLTGTLTVVLALAYAMRAVWVAVASLPDQTVAAPEATTFVYLCATALLLVLSVLLVRVTRARDQVGAAEMSSVA